MSDFVDSKFINEFFPTNHLLNKTIKAAPSMKCINETFFKAVQW